MSHRLSESFIFSNFIFDLQKFQIEENYSKHRNNCLTYDLRLTLSECSKLQNLSAKELLNYEIEVEKQCLNALTKVLEVEIPVVTKAKKQLTKATTDMDNYRIKYQTALKLSQQNTGSAVSSAQKAESLKKELEDSTVKVDQQRVILFILIVLTFFH